MGTYPTQQRDKAGNTTTPKKVEHNGWSPTGFRVCRHNVLNESGAEIAQNGRNPHEDERTRSHQREVMINGTIEENE